MSYQKIGRRAMPETFVIVSQFDTFAYFYPISDFYFLLNISVTHHLRSTNTFVLVPPLHLPEHSLVNSAQQAVTRKRSKELEDRTERIKEMAPCKSKRALDLAAEKGSSA